MSIPFTLADVGAALRLSSRVIWWPFSKLIQATVFVLAPIWTVVSFILLPFIHLVQTIINIITFPFSVQWLDRIETLYIYLGTAALIGCLTGAVIFIIFKLISSTLNIDSAIIPQPQDRARTTAEFRAARLEKKQDAMDFSPASTPAVVKRVPGSRKKGLLSQAIMEEEDSDF